MDYFRHDINASEDDKILALLERGGYEQLGYYWRFVEYLYSRGGKVDKNRICGVAWALHMDVDTLSTVICSYGLFEEDDQYIYSRRVMETLKEYEAVGKRMAEIGRSGGQASAQARAKRALEKSQADGEAEVNRTLNRTLSACSTACQPYAQQNKINKNKKNKINKKDIEDEKRKRFCPPMYVDVERYAIEKGREDLAKAFFEYFDTGKWIDSKGNPVKNWKQKFLTWCNKNPVKAVSATKEAGSFDVDAFFDKAVKRSYENN